MRPRPNALKINRYVQIALTLIMPKSIFLNEFVNPSNQMKGRFISQKPLTTHYRQHNLYIATILEKHTTLQQNQPQTSQTKITNITYQAKLITHGFTKYSLHNKTHTSKIKRATDQSDITKHKSRKKSGKTKLYQAENDTNTGNFTPQTKAQITCLNRNSPQNTTTIKKTKIEHNKNRQEGTESEKRHNTKPKRTQKHRKREQNIPQQQKKLQKNRNKIKISKNQPNKNRKIPGTKNLQQQIKINSEIINKPQRQRNRNTASMIYGTQLAGKLPPAEPSGRTRKERAKLRLQNFVMNQNLEEIKLRAPKGDQTKIFMTNGSEKTVHITVIPSLEAVPPPGQTKHHRAAQFRGHYNSTNSLTFSPKILQHYKDNPNGHPDFYVFRGSIAGPEEYGVASRHPIQPGTASYTITSRLAQAITCRWFETKTYPHYMPIRLQTQTIYISLPTAAYHRLNGIAISHHVFSVYPTSTNARNRSKNQGVIASDRPTKVVPTNTNNKNTTTSGHNATYNTITHYPHPHQTNITTNRSNTSVVKKTYLRLQYTEMVGRIK